jgi:hypothetical protein
MRIGLLEEHMMNLGQLMKIQVEIEYGLMEFLHLVLVKFGHLPENSMEIQTMLLMNGVFLLLKRILIH